MQHVHNASLRTGKPCVLLKLYKYMYVLKRGSLIEPPQLPHNAGQEKWATGINIAFPHLCIRFKFDVVVIIWAMLAIGLSPKVEFLILW